MGAWLPRAQAQAMEGVAVARYIRKLNERTFQALVGGGADSEALGEVYKANLDLLKDHRTVSGHMNTRFGFLLTAFGVFLGLVSRGDYSDLIEHYPKTSILIGLGFMCFLLGLAVALYGINLNGPRVFDPALALREEEAKKRGKMATLLVDKATYYQWAVSTIELGLAGANQKAIKDKVKVHGVASLLLIAGVVSLGLGGGIIMGGKLMTIFIEQAVQAWVAPHIR